MKKEEVRRELIKSYVEGFGKCISNLCEYMSLGEYDGLNDDEVLELEIEVRGMFLGKLSKVVEEIEEENKR